MLFVVKQDVASNLEDVGFFGAVGIVFDANDLAHTIE
jgi:hypothetical protein